MRFKKSVLIIGLLAATSSLALAAGPGNGGGNGGGRGNGGARATASVTLGAEEAAKLQWLREEEKLARDVYLALYNVWQSREFANIAASEQRHFDAMGNRLAQFGLSDPALSAQGRFSTPDLQALHDSLVFQGSASYADALRVGATIEDMDIKDLIEAIEDSSNRSVQTTYGNLLEGSKNHLRAFVGRLNAQGQDYEPQYMDPVLFDATLGR